MIYCPVYALLRHQTANGQNGWGFHLPHMWQYCIEGQLYADIQQTGAGDFAHGFSALRRGSSVWRKRDGGFGPPLPSSSSLPSALSPPRQQRLVARRPTHRCPLLGADAAFRGWPRITAMNPAAEPPPASISIRTR